MRILSCPAEQFFKIKIESEIPLEAGQHSLLAIASPSIRPELMAESRRGGRAIGSQTGFWDGFGNVSVIGTAVGGQHPKGKHQPQVPSNQD